MGPHGSVLCHGHRCLSCWRRRGCKGSSGVFCFTTPYPLHPNIHSSTLHSTTQRTPSFVRLFRDYSVADLCFCGLFAIFAALASFRPGTRATVCEELSRQPELLRDLAEAGLNLENCELWFEHAVVAVVAVIAILLVVRVSIIIHLSCLLPRVP